MKPKTHIVWSKREIDLKNDFQKRWYIQQVLTYGLTQDIRELDLEEIESNLPYLNLPKTVKRLWEDYFNKI